MLKYQTEIGHCLQALGYKPLLIGQVSGRECSSHYDQFNFVYVVPYLVQLLQAIEALYIRVKLKHSASKGGRLLSCIAWRGSTAFRAIKASAVRAFVGMAHHSYNSHSGYGSGRFFLEYV